MAQQLTFLVFGATGGTGKHFVAQALRDGHRVRALVRTLSKLDTTNPNLKVQQGSITDTEIPLDDLVKGSDFVVSMLGDQTAQRDNKINHAFVKDQLVPAMRRHNIKRFLYQAGGLSRPHNGSLTSVLWVIRNTIARDFEGQHRDNEAVMSFLAEEAMDLEWIVHRAGIYGDGDNKGRLERCSDAFSVGNFRDCAEYSHRLVRDEKAVHTADFSQYA